MSTGGDTADQMVREGIQITEEAVKLSALGAKNLAAILLAMMKDNPKMRGRTNLNRLLKDGKELKVFSIKANELSTFKKEAEHYGVLFTAIRDKTSQGELVDVMAHAEDSSKLNRIFERMGYPIKQEKEVVQKKTNLDCPSGADSQNINLGSTQIETNGSKPSVKAKIMKCQAIVEAREKEKQRAAKTAEKGAQQIAQTVKEVEHRLEGRE